MNTIVFKKVLPDVFAGNAGMQSEIWNHEVEFVKGKTYLLEADSGKGKSTFCSYMLGYRKDYTGSIMFDGTDVRTFTVSRWTNVRKNNLSYMFQELRLFPELTAFENIEIKNHLTGFKSRKDIEQWFEQRVAMVRALVQPFDFILVDEPISHLDDSNSQIMGEIMMEEAKRQGAGVIITSIGKHIEMPYDHIINL